MSLTDSRERSLSARPVANADCEWDLFDSDAYQQRNYGTLHDLDRGMIPHIGRFFAAQHQARAKNDDTVWHGIDVGPGTNLYPALAMLPLADTITLWEHSSTNITWLEEKTRPYERSWEPFWRALSASDPLYSQVHRPDQALAATVKIEKGSVFDLPEEQWDIGTMFFVAESITGDHGEFQSATRRFLRSLKPGAPFVAAFMENSRGYSVGDQRFPAVAITDRDLQPMLSELTSTHTIHRIESPEQFREGYDAMILVAGTTRAQRTRRFLVSSGVVTRLVRRLLDRSR